MNFTKFTEIVKANTETEEGYEIDIDKMNELYIQFKQQSNTSSAEAFIWDLGQSEETHSFWPVRIANGWYDFMISQPTELTSVLADLDGHLVVCHFNWDISLRARNWEDSLTGSKIDEEVILWWRRLPKSNCK